MTKRSVQPASYLQNPSGRADEITNSICLWVDLTAHNSRNSECGADWERANSSATRQRHAATAGATERAAPCRHARTHERDAQAAGSRNAAGESRVGRDAQQGE